ncbi:MAG: tRNA-specific adenosine deaminase [Rhodospirillaceae bacterium]|nr:tRNA-specific adenosine deaminase [Rhodospirillaceae bacterium]OUT79148.1 MAG: tRNA-specific adenosine deaminase [Rhodospirillaceae bacterium TMED23]|tara:strand:+ start:240 stop:839 length:600 start_codon:yes stop_codon:yes gene_type:complete
METSQIIFCSKLLSVIEDYIIPLTKIGVKKGNKIFGAAILKKTDLSIVVADTNSEIQNPLFHGEISTINSFFKLPKEERPKPEDCVFISTHEPCSLCLSAITWANFDNFYYYFGYQDTKDTFHIPHDLNILKEVFKIDNGQYARKNKFWESKSVVNMVNELSDDSILDLREQINRINKKYTKLSEIYQKQKGLSGIPLS